MQDETTKPTSESEQPLEEQAPEEPLANAGDSTEPSTKTITEPSAESEEATLETPQAIEDTENDNTANARGHTIDNIEVQVDFRIGEISMPVNELAALAPGFTLTDLPGLIFPRAQALSAGRVFAEGELVDIDGKIGFRITRLLP